MAMRASQRPDVPALKQHSVTRQGAVRSLDSGLDGRSISRERPGDGVRFGGSCLNKIVRGEGGTPKRAVRLVPPQPPSLLPSDPALAELVSLATRLVGASHGVLLLMEPRGDWLLVSHGLDLRGPKLFEDGRLAELTADNARVLRLELPGSAALASHPLVSHVSRLRTYMGAPIVSEDGAWRGALAVLDPGSFQPDGSGLETLEALGRQAAARLQLLRQLRGLEDAEAALRESEERFRLFAQNALDVLYRVSLEPRPRFDFVSGSVTEVLGYLPEEFYADPALALRALHPEERTRQEELRRQLDANDTMALTLRWIRADGTVAYTEHRQRVTRDVLGRVVSIEGIARDVTDRRRAEEQQWKTYALLQAVVDGSNDAIFVKDLEGRYVLINPVGAVLLGREVSEVLGKRDVDLFSMESARDIVDRDQAILAEGKARTYEVESTAAGITHTWLSTKMPLRLREGQVVGLVGVSRDVTSLRAKDAQRALKLDDLLAKLSVRDAWRASLAQRLASLERLLGTSPLSGDAVVAEATRTLRELTAELNAGRANLDGLVPELRLPFPFPGR